MSRNLTDSVLHPIRLRILRALTGKQLSIRSLQSVLSDIPQASLYRHVNKLVAAEVIIVCGENKVKGSTERIYSLPLGEDLISASELKRTTKEVHFRLYSTFIGTLLHDYARYLESGEPDLQRDQVGYRTLQLYLSDEELQKMSDGINHVVMKYLENKPGEGRRSRNFSTILITDKSEGE
ncbi:MAG: helix-turn-helix domain-containing protein [Coxiellaceae bacterium]|nr:helix-turn-helix domain-containing protein [Coxiellaceae bacterium]